MTARQQTGLGNPHTVLVTAEFNASGWHNHGSSIFEAEPKVKSPSCVRRCPTPNRRRPARLSRALSLGHRAR
jgi:hypothetical protein